jgi:hypothetical protein
VVKHLLNRLRLNGIALILLVILALAENADAQTVDLPVTQVQAAAVAAVESGDDALAADLATRLLSQNRRDPLAHFVMAVTAMRAGAVAPARQSARLAFQFGTSDQQRFQTAMIAADIADRTGRSIALRYWLRQAADHAPTPAMQGAATRALADVRAQSPWEASLRLSLAPSSNVNGGSASPFNIIDGLPFVGAIDGDGRAMSGWQGSAQGRLAYRLSRSERGETFLTARIALQRVALSAAARRQAVSLRGADLADSSLTIGLMRRTRAASGKASTEFGLSFGRGVTGTGAQRDLISFDLTRTMLVSDTARLTLGFTFDATNPAAAGRATTRRYGGQLGYSVRRGNGDRLNLDVSLLLTDPSGGLDADQVLKHNRGWVLRVGWQKANPIGPFSVSGSIGISELDYPDFRLGPFPVPGGRQDLSGFGELTLGLDQVSWAGFAPTMTVRARKTTSNVSSYTSDEVSVGFGVSSQF